MSFRGRHILVNYIFDSRDTLWYKYQSNRNHILTWIQIYLIVTRRFQFILFSKYLIQIILKGLT